MDTVTAYDTLAAYPAVRQRRWSAYVHAEPEEAELAGIRRSSATGLPYGEAGWVNRLAGRLKLDLTIRPRGRPRKDKECRKIVLTLFRPPFSTPKQDIPAAPANSFRVTDNLKQPPPHSFGYIAVFGDAPNLANAHRQHLHFACKTVVQTTTILDGSTKIGQFVLQFSSGPKWKQLEVLILG